MTKSASGIHPRLLARHIPVDGNRGESDDSPNRQEEQGRRQVQPAAPKEGQSKHSKGIDQDEDRQDLAGDRAAWDYDQGKNEGNEQRCQ